MLNFLVSLGLASALLLPVAAKAQDAADYPNKPVRIIVTVPPGGAVDLVTRMVAEELRKKFGQPFIVENRGAGAGVAAAEAVLASPPDGYILMASQPAPITVIKLLFSNVNFDPAGVRARGGDGENPKRAAGEKRLSREDRSGISELRQTEPGQGQFRLAGRGHYDTPDRRVVHDAHRHERWSMFPIAAPLRR